MSRGYPDYQSSREHAIALQTVWEDDFEAPHLKWTPVIGFAGVLPILTSLIAFRGTQCVYVEAPIGALNNSAITRTFPLVKYGRFGLEVFVCGDTEAAGYIYLRFTVNDGVVGVQGEWRIDTVNNTLDIISGGIARRIASDIYARVADRYFLPVKIVADTYTSLYTRLMVGPDEYNLSAWPLDVVGGPGFKTIKVGIGVSGDGAARDSKGYVDCFVFSQNEP